MIKESSALKLKELNVTFIGVSTDYICRDSNNLYAESLGLEFVDITKVSTILHISNPVIVEMSWITEEEDINKIRDRLECSLPTILRLVDNNEQSFIQVGYKSTLEFLNKYSACKLMSPYEVSYKGHKPDIVFPYHYETDKFIYKSPASKIDRISVTGVLNEVYPQRLFLYEMYKDRSVRLSHPGYEGEKKHHIIKDDYIKYLSCFKYALICPSLQDTLLLKYIEIAEAGCIPIGYAPTNIPLKISPNLDSIDYSAEDYRKDLIKYLDGMYESSILKLKELFRL